jgi:hypothetical protein
MKQKARSFAVAAHGDQMYGDKTADRLANVRACLKDRKQGLWEMYRGEHATFRSAVYLPGLYDALWLELDSSLSEKAHAGCHNYNLEDAAEAREFLAQFRQYLREHPV